MADHGVTPTRGVALGSVKSPRGQRGRAGQSQAHRLVGKLGQTRAPWSLSVGWSDGGPRPQSCLSAYTSRSPRNTPALPTALPLRLSLDSQAQDSPSQVHI